MRDYLDTRPLKLRNESVVLSAPRRVLARTLVLAFLAVGLMLLDQRGMLTPLRGLLDQAVQPVALRLTHARSEVVGFWIALADMQELREENRMLRQEVGQLKADLIEREQVAVENTHLRQQLQIESRHPWQVVGADVMVRTPDAGRRTMTINCGSDDGVARGMAVLGQTEGDPASLIGIVESVSRHTANVVLITDFSSRISVRVLHDNASALGLVQGQWQQGSRLRLEQLDRTAPLDSNTVVVSAGLSGQLDQDLPLSTVPAGIPVGRVETVLNSDGHSQLAELRPYVDPDQVRYVWVILNHDE